MRRSSLLVQSKKPEGMPWSTWAQLKAKDLANRVVPDPRMSNRGAYSGGGYTEFKEMNDKSSGREHDPEAAKLEAGESLEDYIRKRNQRFVESNQVYTKEGLEKKGFHTNEMGGHFSSPSFFDKDRDTLENAKEAAIAKFEEESKVDPAAIAARRQLMIDHESDFRKHVAEKQRERHQNAEYGKMRMASPSDPNYDPFRNVPYYRPSDSRQLAKWVKRRLDEGRTLQGDTIETREKQERYYNENAMATQYSATPYLTRVELPKGKYSTEVTGYTPDSLILNGREVIGSCIITPTRYYHWNVADFSDINLKSLSLLLHMYPVPDIVYLGTGRNQYWVSDEIFLAFRKRGVRLHCMTTPDALEKFGHQLTERTRVCFAGVMPVPTNPYQKEAFGDFIENDAYSLSDYDLGVRPERMFRPELMQHNSVAEKYRKNVGSGIGPKYKEMGDGRLVRPGTYGTKLRPLLEPGEEDSVEWEKLPSYYHWFPKENEFDYIENRTWREAKAKVTKEAGLYRADALITGDLLSEREFYHNPDGEEMPWDSKSIPLATLAELKDDREILVHDPKSARMVGMGPKAFDVWKKMMEARKKGEEPEQEVEFDQERFVTDKRGKLLDLSKTSKFVPLSEHNYSQASRGLERSNHYVPPG